MERALIGSPFSNNLLVNCGAVATQMDFRQSCLMTYLEMGPKVARPMS
jgi:hypothetical protein